MGWAALENNWRRERAVMGRRGEGWILIDDFTLRIRIGLSEEGIFRWDLNMRRSPSCIGNWDHWILEIFSGYSQMGYGSGLNKREGEVKDYLILKLYFMLEPHWSAQLGFFQVLYSVTSLSLQFFTNWRTWLPVTCLNIEALFWKMYYSWPFGLLPNILNWNVSIFLFQMKQWPVQW